MHLLLIIHFVCFSLQNAFEIGVFTFGDNKCECFNRIKSQRSKFFCEFHSHYSFSNAICVHDFYCVFLINQSKKIELLKMNHKLNWSCADKNEPKIYPLHRENKARTKIQERRYHKRNERLALKFRKRDRKEFEVQFKHEDYLMDLMEVESEIDEFLKKGKSDVPPTQRMISYAKHPWPYNEMKQKRRYQLSLIRCRVEEHLDNENTLNTMYSTLQPVKEIKRPICCICRSDLVEEFPDTTPFKLSCGHVLHFPCMLQYFFSPCSKPGRVYEPFPDNIAKCPICQKIVNSDNASPLFLSYE